MSSDGDFTFAPAYVVLSQVAAVSPVSYRRKTESPSRTGYAPENWAFKVSMVGGGVVSYSYPTEKEAENAFDNLLGML